MPEPAATAPAMAEPERYLDAAAAAVGLPVAEAHRPGVVRFLTLAAEMAAVLERVDLGDELALASVYRLPSPGERA